MLSKRFLPPFFSEVIAHIPSIALKSMDWKGVLKELLPVAKGLGKDGLDDEKIQRLKSEVGVEINFLKHDAKVEDSLAYSEDILKVYFSQLSNESGLSLDLRSKFFAYKDSKLTWWPSGVWYKFEDSFRLNLIDLYKGFYYEDGELYSKALKNIGLTKNLSSEKAKELESLFKDHFGAGASEAIQFKLKDFQDSFSKMFKFFSENKVDLHKDFVFLGIYLVTLYMNLEFYGKKVDVKKAFLSIYPRS